MPHEERRISGITAVILAGGRNTRYPEPKGLIKIDGFSIIDRNLALLHSIFDDICISTNSPEIYFRFGARLLGDVLASRGPMSGIYTALRNSGGNDVFVMACDMPFPSAGLIKLICEKHLDNGMAGEYDATIPVFGGKPQPLFGVYCRTVINSLEDAIISDKVCLVRFLEDISVFYVDEAEIRSADQDGRSFMNINTPEDYDAVVGRMFATSDIQDNSDITQQQ